MALATPSFLSGDRTLSPDMVIDAADDVAAVNGATAELNSLGGGRLVLERVYQIDANITIPVGVTLVGVGGLLQMANTFTTTVNGGVEAQDQVFDCTACVASGGVAFGSAKDLRPEWWGTCSASNNTVQWAIDSAQDGSRILLSDQYEVSATVLNATLVTGLSIIGVGAPAGIGVDTANLPGLYLADSQDADTLSVIGSATSCNYFLDNFKINGNVAGQGGNYYGLEINNVTDLHIGTLVVEDCGDDCIVAIATSDIVVGTLVVGGSTAAAGADLSGLTDSRIGSIVSTSNFTHGVQLTGSRNHIGSIRATDNTSDTGLQIIGDDNDIGSVLASGNGTSGVQINSGDRNTIAAITAFNNGNAGLRILGTAAGNRVGHVTAYDDQGGGATQDYAIYVDSTGSNNRIASWTHDGNMVTQSIYIHASNSVDVGNAVGQLPKQNVVYASDITPDPWEGAVIKVGALTGGITVNAPTGTKQLAGARLTFHFLQDGSGSHAVTWNAAFATTWAPDLTPSSVSTISFYFDGTSWTPVTGGAAGLGEAFPGSETAHTVFVCETASVFSADGSANAPFTTIAPALAAAAALSPTASNIIDIAILPGKYAEAVSLLGASHNYVNLIGLDAAGTIITASIADTLSLDAAMTSCTIKNLTIEATSTYRPVDSDHASGTLILENCLVVATADNDSSFANFGGLGTTRFINTDLIHAYVGRWMLNSSASDLVFEGGKVVGRTRITANELHAVETHFYGTSALGVIDVDAGSPGAINIRLRSCVIEGTTNARIHLNANANELTCLACQFIGTTVPDIYADVAVTGVRLTGNKMDTGIGANVLVDGQTLTVGGEFDYYASHQDAVDAINANATPSASNRFTIQTVAGIYDVGATTLTIKDDFVNFVGFDRDNTIIESTTASVDVVTFAAGTGDNSFENLTLRCSGSSTGKLLFNEQILSTAKPIVFRNCSLHGYGSVSTNNFVHMGGVDTTARVEFYGCDIFNSTASQYAIRITATGGCEFVFHNSNVRGQYADNAVGGNAELYAYDSRFYSELAGSSNGTMWFFSTTNRVLERCTVENGSTGACIFANSTVGNLTLRDCIFDGGSSGSDITGSGAGVLSAEVSNCVMKYGMTSAVATTSQEKYVGGTMDFYGNIARATGAVNTQSPAVDNQYTIKIRPGIHAGAVAIPVSYIHIEGENPASTFITHTGGDTLTINSAVTVCTIKNVTIEQTGGNKPLVIDSDGGLVQVEGCRVTSTADEAGAYSAITGTSTCWFTNTDFIHSYPARAALLRSIDGETRFDNCKIVGSFNITNGDIWVTGGQISSTSTNGVIDIDTTAGVNVYLKAVKIDSGTTYGIHLSVDATVEALGCEFVGSTLPDIFSSTTSTKVTVKGCKMAMGLDSSVSTTNVQKNVGGEYDFYEDMAAAVVAANSGDVIHVWEDQSSLADLAQTASPVVIDAHKHALTGQAASTLLTVGASEKLTILDADLTGDLEVDGSGAALLLERCTSSTCRIEVLSGGDAQTHVNIVGCDLTGSIHCIYLQDDDPMLTIWSSYIVGAGEGDNAAIYWDTGIANGNVRIGRSTLGNGSSANSPLKVASAVNPNYRSKHSEYVGAVDGAFTNLITTHGDIEDDADLSFGPYYE